MVKCPLIGVLRLDLEWLQMSYKYQRGSRTLGLSEYSDFCN